MYHYIQFVDTLSRIPVSVVREGHWPAICCSLKYFVSFWYQSFVGLKKNEMGSISSSWWSILGVHLARVQSLVIQSKSYLRVAVDVIGVRNQLTLRKIIFTNLCGPASVSWKALGAKASLKKKKFCLWITLSSPTWEFQPTLLTSCPVDFWLV